MVITEERKLSQDNLIRANNNNNNNVNINNQMETINGNGNFKNQMLLTPEELNQLDNAYSQLFSNLKLDDQIKNLLAKAIKVYEIALLNRNVILERFGNRPNCSTVQKFKSNPINPDVFCKLGHYNYLLGNYSKALSAYQRYLAMEKNHWKNPSALLGLGLTYFHYNAFNWAIKAFKQLIYTEPSFARTNEAYVRLGIIYKCLQHYGLAHKNFRIALNDSNICSFGKNEIQFHIAHLFELEGKIKIARENYLTLLKQKDISKTLNSEILGQLGWLSYLNENNTADNNNNQYLEAIKFLTDSIELQSHPRNQYYLGRCYACINQVQDAFVAYRHSVDKTKENSDTWCSIGILYHKEKQPLDALQAYICSVQLNKDNSTAWINLGILYENYNQFYDAFKCYIHATNTKKGCSLYGIIERVNYFKSQSHNLLSISSQKLPTLEMAWNSSVDNTDMVMKRQANDNHTAKRLKADNNQNADIYNSHILNYLQQKNDIKTQLTNSLTNTTKLEKNAQINKNQSPTLNTNSFFQNKTKRSYSVDSDAMSNNTISSDDSAIDSKDIYSSQFSNQNLNSNLITKDKEDAIISLLCSPDPSQQDPSNLQPKLTIEMTSKEIVNECKKFSPKNTKIISSITSDDGCFPYPPDPPYPPIPSDKLHPPAPMINIENKKEAFSPELQQFCLSNSIAVIRGLSSVLKLDLGLFSTKTLVESNSDHSIEVRRQYLQPSDENWDPEHRDMVWYCESQRSHTTIARYGHYQALSFSESLKEDKEKSSTPILRDSDSDSNSTFAKMKKTKKYSMFKPVKFGTNVDLSDTKKWKLQLQELAKLPPFARVSSAANMLTHVGHTILGMNSVQLYMKVPGCRTPGHQENNNFCSVNINIGPGDCEWFGVSPEYWGVIHRICERHNINYLHGSWWPLLDDLYAEHVPLYRFVQKPGDIVWVGAGTVHWVQAIGWCNNIAWNVGPFTSLQYDLAIKRYEWNKHEQYKSIVPMINLTWNIARNVKILDKDVFILMKSVLLRSLKYIIMISNLINDLNLEIILRARELNEPAHYCVICDIEVFDILFVKELERKHVVHCYYCASKMNPQLSDFVILEEYKLEELQKLYDDFQLVS